MRRIVPLLLGLPLLLAACQPQLPAIGGSGSSSSTLSSTPADLPQTFAYPAFSISLPAGWTAETGSTLPTDAGAFEGTAFIMPASQLLGTTLLEAKVHVAVPPSCPTQSAARITQLGRNAWRTSTWSGVGAGNLYEGRLFVAFHARGCVVVTEYLHSCNLGPDCGPEHARPFDRAATLALLDRIVATLQWK